MPSTVCAVVFAERRDAEDEDVAKPMFDPARHPRGALGLHGLRQDVGGATGLLSIEVAKEHSPRPNCFG